MCTAGFKLLEYLPFANNLDELQFQNLHGELPAAD